MKKTQLIHVLLLAFAILTCTSGVASANYYFVPKYVGNTMVDLSWIEHKSTDFSKYELCRDGVPITTITDRRVTFYRDNGLTKGNTYDYEIRVYNATGVLKATRTTSATTGEVRGTITIDTTWTTANSPSTLTGGVFVRNGSTLTIGGGAVIVNESNYRAISVKEKGALYADGASFYGVSIWVHDSYAGIKNCFFEHANIGLSNSNNSVITGNILNNSKGRGIGLCRSSNNAITGNTVSNNRYDGIHLSYSSNNNAITGNTVSNNRYDGIDLSYSSNNTIITGNTVSNNSYCGISLSYSSNNTIITGNTVSNNGGGISLSYSSNNTIITGNTVSNNSGAIGLSYSSNNDISDNTVSNNSDGISLWRSSNNNISDNTISNNRHDGISLSYSSNNDISDNTISNNSDDGISLSYSSNNDITDNTASNNSGGISLWRSSNNDISDNTVSNNSFCGIYSDFSSNDNTIYNNYFNNTKNAYDYDGNNTWNITKTAGTNIVGGHYLGGNYWSDYGGADLDGDRLGDTLLPYNCSGGIQNGGDYHPLIIIPKIILKASKDGYVSVQHEMDNDENFEQIEISGRVIDELTSEPIADAEVEILKGADPASTTTDVDGNYSITALIPDGSGSDTREYVNFELPPAEYIVAIYKISSEVYDLIGENNGTVIAQALYEDWPQGLLVKISKEEDVDDFITNVGSSPLVRYVTHNSVFYAAYIPNDPLYPMQWGPRNIRAGGPPNPSAWDVETGDKNIIIAIIDTGIQCNHQDLYRFNDGTVKYVHGYDWVDLDNDPSQVLPCSHLSHGTHCAGIATAVMDNGTGIAGIAPNCSFIAERVLGRNGRGSAFNISRGIVDAANHGADIISMSFGLNFSNPWYENSTRNAYNRSCILVAASGNDAHRGWYTGIPPRGICYPAAYPWVIAVGNIDENNQRRRTSNWGNELELVAPGTNITSTTYGNSYGNMTGTSMATPHVAGVAALVKSRAERWHPEMVPIPKYHLNSAQIRQVLIQSATDLGPHGWDREYGWGKVDAARAIRCVNISGNVTEALNNAPILHPPDVPSPPMVNVTSIEGPPGNFTTNENTPLARITRGGDYHVRVPPGVYSICAMAYGYNSSRGLGGERVELPAFDLVGRLNEEHRNFSLDPFRCNVTGIVNDSETGLPINEANVSLDGPPLITPAHSNVCMDTKTDSTGKYSFTLEYSVHPPYPTGEAVYNITVSKPRYQNQTKNFTLNWSNIVTDYYKCPLDPNDYNPPIVNFSLLSEFNVSGHKFNDTNGNGVWDSNEPGLAGWTIRLDGTAEDGSIISLTATTDGNGRYRFEDVPRGNYTLSEVLEAGWIQTCPAPLGTYLIIITNADVIDRDFGNRRFKVTGHKFNDTNGNGVWDPNEPGLAGWTIRLDGTAEDGTTVSLTTTTDDNGRYRFEDVPRGNYTISEVLEAGWIQTCPAPQGTYTFTITNADVVDRDFGNRMFRVTGHKFNDINGNGVWDSNEPALAGWTIELDGTADDGTTVSRTNITDYNGYYEFRDVSEGTYTLSELLKVGWMRTCPPPPGTHTIDVTDDDVLGKNFGNRGFIHYDETIIVGAPTEDVEGSKDQGRVYRFYGLTGKLRHTIDCPSLQPDALFGYSVSSGMVGSDYRDEIVVGAPGEGRVYTFYGATSKLHHTIDCPSPQPDASFGYSVSTGDVNGDGFDEIIVGAPYEDVGDNESQGRVYTFYALTGKLHHTIDCPSPQPDALFGHSVSTGDVNGDGFDEIIVGAPYEDVGDNESQGRAYTFYGLTSKLRHILDCPNPRPDASFGYSVNAVDLVSDYREEVIVGAPGEDVGDNESQGRAYTFYGATGKLHLPLNCTSPKSNVDFGHSLSVGDTSGDGLNDVIVGAPGEGRVYTFYGLTGKLRHTIDCPIPQPDALFGWSVNAGTVGSDYRDEVIVGAPGEDAGENVDQGRVYTFYGATSKLRHTLDTPNPQSGANFGWSVGVTGGFMVVTCSDPSVNVDYTQTSVTDDPVGEGYDLSNAPANVDLTYAKGFNITATGPDGSYLFDVTFSSPIIESSVLHKLPAWTETPHTMIGPNTIQVQLDIIEGVLDPPFILAPVEGVRLPDLTLTSGDIRFIPTASTSTSSYSSGQTTLTKDIHKPKSAPNILKNVKSAQPYKEIISREVMSSSDTPSFTIENLAYPPTVNPNQTFQVTVDTNYSFNATTNIFVGIWDYNAWDYIAETSDNETLSGTGSKSYTFNLTAPPSGIMHLSADACYWDGYDWSFTNYRDFNVNVSVEEPDFTIENLTYPPTVNPNQIFQVTIATNYSFNATTDIFTGIWDRDASDYIAGTPKNETLSGTGSRSYTFNLTAPASGTLNLSATLWYRDDHGDGILSDYRAFNVHVGLEEPDFVITATPHSQTVSQDDSAPYTISLTSLNGFNSPVTLNVSGLPTGATGIFNPSPVTPSDSATLTINTSTTTPTGNYTLTITGVGGEITRQTTVALNITTGEENVTTISATIHNIGTADASNVTVQFFDGDPDAGGIQIGNEQTITSIPAGGAEMVSVDWVAETGAHAIYVWVDPFDSIQESNEENNIAFNTILLGTRGDLNNDGTITPADAVIALEIAAGTRSFDPATLAAADVSGDGQVTSLDALMIMQAAIGAIDI